MSFRSPGKDKKGGSGEESDHTLSDETVQEQESSYAFGVVADADDDQALATLVEALVLDLDSFGFQDLSNDPVIQNARQNGVNLDKTRVNINERGEVMEIEEGGSRDPMTHELVESPSTCGPPSPSPVNTSRWTSTPHQEVCYFNHGNRDESLIKASESGAVLHLSAGSPRRDSAHSMDESGCAGEDPFLAFKTTPRANIPQQGGHQLAPCVDGTQGETGVPGDDLSALVDIQAGSTQDPAHDKESRDCSVDQFPTGLAPRAKTPQKGVTQLVQFHDQAQDLAVSITNELDEGIHMQDGSPLDAAHDVQESRCSVDRSPTRLSPWTKTPQKTGTRLVQFQDPTQEEAVTPTPSTAMETEVGSPQDSACDGEESTGTEPSPTRPTPWTKIPQKGRYQVEQLHDRTTHASEPGLSMETETGSPRDVDESSFKASPPLVPTRLRTKIPQTMMDELVHFFHDLPPYQSIPFNKLHDMLRERLKKFQPLSCRTMQSIKDIVCLRMQRQSSLCPDNTSDPPTRAGSGAPASVSTTQEDSKLNTEDKNSKKFRLSPCPAQVSGGTFLGSFGQTPQQPRVSAAINEKTAESGGSMCHKCGVKPKRGHLCPFRKEKRDPKILPAATPNQGSHAVRKHPHESDDHRKVASMPPAKKRKGRTKAPSAEN